MADVDRLLADLPEESPPPEIVLSALRTFRYRAIAVVASLLAGILFIAVLVPVLQPESIGEQAARARSHGVTPLLASVHIDSVQVLLVELVQGDGEGFIHFVAQEHGEEVAVEVMFDAIQISPSDLSAGTVLVDVPAEGDSFEIGAVDQVGSSHFGGIPAADSGWIRFEGDHDPNAPLAVFFQLVVVPPDALLTGSFEATPVTVRIDYPGALTS